jgi:hypothetical protein
MKKILNVLVFNFLFVGGIFAQQAKFPTFQISGANLKSIFDAYETLVGDVTFNAATKEISISFTGIRSDGTTSPIITLSAPISYYSYPQVPTDQALTLQDYRRRYLPYVCSTYYGDFVIDSTKTYYLVPGRFKDAIDGNFYISYKIKDSASLAAPSYKTINPIPPGGSTLSF